jgi:hypothetical protein
LPNFHGIPGQAVQHKGILLNGYGGLLQFFRKPLLNNCRLKSRQVELATESRLIGAALPAYATAGCRVRIRDSGANRSLWRLPESLAGKWWNLLEADRLKGAGIRSGGRS